MLQADEILYGKSRTDIWVHYTKTMKSAGLLIWTKTGEPAAAKIYSGRGDVSKQACVAAGDRSCRGGQRSRQYSKGGR